MPSNALLQRLVASLASLSDSAFACLWSLVLTFGAQYRLWQHGHRTLQDFLLLTAIWLLGSFAAGFLARISARLVSGHRQPHKRFAAMLFFLPVFSVVLTSTLFAMEYRIYFSQWHDTAFSKWWLIEQVFTAANAFYLFIATAVTPMMTLPNLALFIVICWVFKPALLQAKPMRRKQTTR